MVDVAKCVRRVTPGQENGVFRVSPAGLKMREGATEPKLRAISGSSHGTVIKRSNFYP